MLTTQIQVEANYNKSENFFGYSIYKMSKDW